MTTHEAVPLTPELEARLRELDVAREKVLRQFKPLEQDPEFVFAGLQLEAMNQVQEAMEREGITAAMLARRLGCSRQNVHRMLTDEANFKLEMLAKLAVALGRDVVVRLVRRDEEVVVRHSFTASESASRVEAIPCARSWEPVEPERQAVSPRKQVEGALSAGAAA